MLATAPQLIDINNDEADRTREDVVCRMELPGPYSGPLRISAEVRTEGVTGPAGGECNIFSNVEYSEGPIFWDTFLYPDTGSTPWRTLSCDVRSRGAVCAVETHIRFRAGGRLLVRNICVEAIDPWIDDAEVVVAIFGDSTDMTNYLPNEHRLGHRLELLLRDSFCTRRIDVHCLAEGGEYLQRLLESGRLERELRVLPRCDIALIRYGLNDRSREIAPQAFRTQLEAACDAIQAHFPQVQLVLSTTIPPSATVYDEQTQAVAKARNLPLIPLNELIRKRSAAGDNDWHNQPGSYIGRRREHSVREPGAAGNHDGLDGDIHPNAYGAQMIAEYYFETLEPIIKKVLGEK